MLEFISNLLRKAEGVTITDAVLEEVERQSYWLQGEVDWSKYASLKTLSERVAHAAADYYINWIKNDAQEIFGSPTEVHTKAQDTEVIKWFYVPVHATEYDYLDAEWIIKDTYAYRCVGVKANFGEAITFEREISKQEEKDTKQIVNEIIKGIRLKGFLSNNSVDTHLKDLPNIQMHETREGKMPEFNPSLLSKYLLAELVSDTVFDFQLCKQWTKRVNRREDTSPEKETLPLAPQELREFPFTLPNLIRTINAVLQTVLNLRTSEFWFSEYTLHGGGRAVELTFSLLPPQVVSTSSEGEKEGFPLFIRFTFAFPHGWAGKYIPTDFSVRLTKYEVFIGDLTGDTNGAKTKILFGKVSPDSEHTKRLIEEENQKGQEWYETVYKWSSLQKPIASAGMNLNEVREIVTELAEHLKGTELFRKFLEWNNELKEITSSIRLTEDYKRWLERALPKIWVNSIASAVLKGYIEDAALEVFEGKDYLPTQINIVWSYNGLQVRFTVKPLGVIEITFKEFIIGNEDWRIGLDVKFHPVNRKTPYDFGVMSATFKKQEYKRSEPLKQAIILTVDALMHIFISLLPSMIAQVKGTKD